jgi:REase_DpnII-MboI
MPRQFEYDVQDLLHALLHLYCDDIRTEEWTPSYAGASSRMDFLLKKEKIVVEVKKTRQGLDAREVGEQLSLMRVNTLNIQTARRCFALYMIQKDGYQIQWESNVILHARMEG